MKKSIAYLNGGFIFEEEASIPINDRGFLFGDGIFTTIKVEEGTALCLQLHLERLSKQCRSIGIHPPMISQEDVKRLILENRAEEGCWKLKVIVTGGEASELNLTRRTHGQVIMTIKPHQRKERDYKLLIYPGPICRPCEKLKTLAYLDRLWIADYAQKLGFDDALVQNPQGILLEASFANIFWCLEGRLMTPSSTLPLMQGVTLGVICQAAVKELNMEVVEVEATLEDIPLEAQLYLCNSFGISSIVAVGKRLFKPNVPFKKILENTYQKFISSLFPYLCLCLCLTITHFFIKLICR